MAYRQSSNPVYNQDFADSVLNCYNTRPAAALLSSPTLRLITDGTVPSSPNTPFASLSGAQANFTGYSAASPTFSGPANSGTNSQALIGSGTYIAATTGTFVANTVTGYYVQSGSNWVLMEQFGTGNEVTFAQANDFLQLDVALPFVEKAAGA